MAENANRVFTSKIAAMITPAAIIGIFGYVSWVVVALIACRQPAHALLEDELMA